MHDQKYIFLIFRTPNLSTFQEAPPLPKRLSPLSHSLSQTLTNTSSNYTTDRSYNDDLTPNTTNREYSGRSPVENRSMSLQRLDRDTGEEIPIVTPLTSNSPVPLKTVTCLTYSLHSPGMLPHSLIDHQTDHHDVLRPNPLYQASEELDETPAQDKDNLYTEVSERHSLPTPCSDDNPYELIEASQGNLYEKLEDMKSKNSKSTIGKTVCMKIRSD